MPLCKLCHLDKPLLKHSHILPDFIYHKGNVYNKNHSIEIFTIYDLQENKRSRKASNGEYESCILCKTCDNEILGSYETYGRKVIYGDLSPDEEITCSQHKNDNQLKFSFCTNVDYKLFKLYLLSLFWRMSISNRPFFKNVKLKDEETLRKMLYEGNPKKFYEYPVYSSYFTKDNTIPQNFIAEPTQEECENFLRVILILPGLIHMLETTTIKQTEFDQKHMVVNEQNELSMTELKKGQTLKYLLKFMK